MRWVVVSLYVVAFFLMEYLYLPFEGSERGVKILLKDFSVRLDSYMYFLFVKVEQLIFVLLVQYLLPDLWKYTRWLVLAFFLAVIEYPLTYNEAIYKIPLPIGLHIPISVGVLKLIAVCYFMYGCVKKAMQ